MKKIIILALAGTLAGCANMPPELSKIGDNARQAFGRFAGRGASFEAPLPIDGIQARDQGLTDALTKVGKFAAKHAKTEPMVVTVYAPQTEHDYLVRSIRAGIPAEITNAIAINPVDTPTPRITVRTARESKAS